MTKQSLTIEQTLYRLGIAAATLAAAIVVLLEIFPGLYSILVWPCPILSFTGLYCPGCGGSSAITALFHGHVLESLYYHPFVLYGLVFYGFFMTSHTLSILTKGRVKGLRYRGWYAAVGVVLVIGNCIIKNIMR